jgi:hypothetical protein
MKMAGNVPPLARKHKFRNCLAKRCAKQTDYV